VPRVTTGLVCQPLPRPRSNRFVMVCTTGSPQAHCRCRHCSSCTSLNILSVLTRAFADISCHPAAKVSLAQAFRDVECPEDKCDDRPKGNVTIDRHHAAPNPNYRCEPASTADTEALISHSEWKERLRQGGFGQRTLKSDPEPQPEVGYLIAARNIVSELWTMAKVKVSKWLWG